jgi:serine/threonine-protein kinase
MVGFVRSEWLVRWFAACSLLGVLASAGQARAQGDAATAEVLFQQGRDLLRAGKAAEACPKLAESQRLDPATGTLLALAMCHEADGKLASAWAEFVSVEARARNEGRTDREKVARTRAQALRPRLSTLEIRVPDAVAQLPGLEIRRDGVELGRGAWNVAVPMDGGEHVLEVRATGKSPWQGAMTVKTESDAVVFQVPPLRDAPKPATGAVPPAAAKGATTTDAGKARGWATLEWTAVATAGTGAVVLGVGGYFLSNALGKRAESDEDCSGNVCGPRGYTQREEAVREGNTATILGIAGGALLAGGATLFIVGRVNARSSREESPAISSLSLSVAGGPQGFDARLASAF